MLGLVGPELPKLSPGQKMVQDQLDRMHSHVGTHWSGIAAMIKQHESKLGQPNWKFSAHEETFLMTITYIIPTTMEYAIFVRVRRSDGTVEMYARAVPAAILEKYVKAGWLREMTQEEFRKKRESLDKPLATR